jgi:hypothetical protein
VAKARGIVPDEVVDAFRKNAVPGELDGVAAQARALRGWFRPFVHKHMGRPLEPTSLRELEPLNQVLGRDEEFGEVVVRERLDDRQHDHARKNGEASGLAWHIRRRWRSPESPLFPVAWSLAYLVCSEDFTYVKACEGPPCTLLFIDQTRRAARAGGAAWRSAATEQNKLLIDTGLRTRPVMRASRRDIRRGRKTSRRERSHRWSRKVTVNRTG